MRGAGARMSDEPEARMWEDGGSRYETRSRGVYFESAFASSEHLDRAPLLSEVSEFVFFKHPFHSLLEENCDKQQLSDGKNLRNCLFTC